MISPKGTEAKDYFITSADAGQRLDRFLKERLPHVSRREIGLWIRDRRVICNGRATLKGHHLRKGDLVTVQAPVTGEEIAVVPEEYPSLRVLFEDPFLVALDKPAGMATHPLLRGEGGAAANALVARYPEMQGVGFSPLEPGVVHRLDRDTSGVLLAARRYSAFEQVRAQFRQSLVIKTYLAVVHGQPPGRGIVDLRLGSKGRRTSRVVVVTSEKVAAEMRRVYHARTVFRVVGIWGPYSLVCLRMTTGVRHQLRAHMAHIGHPVVGDALYGGEHGEMSEDRSRPSRHYLHAAAIRLYHPAEGRPLRIRSPLPDDFLSFLAACSS